MRFPTNTGDEPPSRDQRQTSAGFASRGSNCCRSEGGSERWDYAETGGGAHVSQSCIEAGRDVPVVCTLLFF